MEKIKKEASKLANEEPKEKVVKGAKEKAEKEPKTKAKKKSKKQSKKKVEKTVSLNEDKSKKREKILKRIRLVDNPELEMSAREALREYLTANHKSKTPERDAVLSVMYRLTVPADIEAIHALVEQEFGHMSPTTVYYSLELLIEAKLVNRIELIEKGKSFYERTLGTKPHGYSICRTCGAIKELPLEDLSEPLKKRVAFGFRVENISLFVYGTCRACHTIEIRKQKNSTNNNI